MIEAKIKTNALGTDITTDQFCFMTNSRFDNAEDLVREVVDQYAAEGIKIDPGSVKLVDEDGNDWEPYSMDVVR